MAKFFPLSAVIVSLALASVVSGACVDNSQCRDCLNLPMCSWCAEISTSTTIKRCRDVSENASCDPNFLFNPRGSKQVSINQPFNTSTDEIDLIQLSPQLINAKLRVGESQKINVTLKKLIDYPLDLYYLLDCSLSMKDDLEMLKILGSRLVDEIQSNVTENVQVGFGTFVDKVILPFATTDPDWLNSTCKGEVCQNTFGFHHQLAITPDSSKFQKTVDSTIISANIDRPEGGFDALMQISVCQDIINWRKESLRMVILTTDAVPHHALDGALVGLLEPNDMKCHLEKVNSASEIYFYTETVKQDYPSVGQLREVFAQNKIQTIFAVTQNVYNIYKELPKVLTDAYVEVLNQDSSNILSVIADAYNAVKSRFSLVTPTAPPLVDLSYRVLCPGSATWVENSLQCNNVIISDEVVFQFELKAKACPNDTTQKDLISIAANIIPDVVNISIEYLCGCDCDSYAEHNSQHCSGRGSLKCGTCECNEGFAGVLCQCESHLTSSNLIQQCRDNSSGRNDQVCHGRGTCDCGKCNCETGYMGKYCECDRTGCPVSSDGSLCGGPTRGLCERCYDNARCLCNSAAGWTPNSAGLCACNENLCKATPSGDLCSGRGTCNCRSCVCNNGTTWTGTYCDTCLRPSCNNITATCAGTELQKCALCVYGSQGTADCQQQCQALGVNFRRVVSLPDCSVCEDYHRTTTCLQCQKSNVALFKPLECPLEDASSCKFKYRIVWHSDYNNYFLYVEYYDTLDCPQPLNPLYYVIPIVSAIVLGGIIALIAWKISKRLYYKRQYKQFNLELENRKWTRENNPGYVAPMTVTYNPKFIGKDDIDEVPGDEKGNFKNATYTNVYDN